MSKIDTQGMSGPVDPNYKGSKSSGEYKPAIVNPRRLFTETYAKELKILINEVLDEREYKKRMAGPYDDVKPLPPSYFDTKHFQYRVGEEEPPYEDWRQPDFHAGLSPEYKPGYDQ
tara:strand:+ start:247 stop:594 length:348 start_codon:yes stop_codon:yes gene_type:complete